jgi:endoglucanase
VPATANALAAITNPDGPIGKLIFDFQKYLDSGTGTSAECVSSYLTEDWEPAAQWLRCHGRQALLVSFESGESGGEGVGIRAND